MNPKPGPWPMKLHWLQPDRENFMVAVVHEGGGPGLALIDPEMFRAAHEPLKENRSRARSGRCFAYYGQDHPTNGCRLSNEIQVVAVAAAAIGGDQQTAGLRMALSSHEQPPAANRVDGKTGGIVIGADTHPAFVVSDGPQFLLRHDQSCCGPCR